MKSIDNLLKLAARFERKLALAQSMGGEDPKAVVSDAFFGPNQENNFLQTITTEGSNFLKALPESIKTVDIGARVSAKGKSAAFLVTTNPAAPPAIQAALVNALTADYTKKYGQSPQAQFAARLAAGTIKPADVELSHPSIIQVH